MSSTERCHYSQHPEFGPVCAPVIGYLAQLRAGGFAWIRPVCREHATARALAGEVLLAKRDDLRWSATCGAWVVVAAGPEGEIREQRLCVRSEGPCPYPTAPIGTLGDHRICAEVVERQGTIDLVELTDGKPKRPGKSRIKPRVSTPTR